MAFSSKLTFFEPGARLVTSRSIRRKAQSESSRLEIRDAERENNTRLHQLRHVSRSQSSSTDLKFARVQPSSYEEEGPNHQGVRVFGYYFSREAVNMIDDEYRAAAWLRAESHWEHQANDSRYALAYKRKFAEQEFIALKRRCKGYLDDHKYCTCIVTVDNKADRNITRGASKTSIVGTLDLCIQHLLQGESYPGEKAKVVPRHLLSNVDRKTCSKRYGYLASLCVARAARRRGIATNMLLFALTTAKLRGADQVYAHVHRDNLRAQQLYEKHGFEIVAHASERLLKENTYLLCCNLLYKTKFSVTS